ncbi:MAG: SDR family NAD(P)-dependent oxidoreductase [Candidatus Binatus sp.]|uniref:SDR family NAD(P)-dependent oxidoreductase n=1 Tax=Candidatus Binatus sp. TaxID=2811406 RepID=UPI003C793B36
MQTRLTGKVALIVGGGADGPAKAGEKLSIGNGRATAIVCAREGAAVMVADRSLELAEQTAAAIRDEGGRAEAVAADVSIEEQCRGAVEATIRAFSALHLMVNNVGIAIGANLLKTTTAQFDTMLAVNLRGHFLMMRYAVPEIAKAGGGAIVNVSSLAALRSNSVISYEATKAAILGLSRSAAVSHARDNIRVNTILPGLIDSSMVRRLVGDRESAVAARIPLRRQGTPWEIANAIVFLLSDDASYITGTELIVDGGLAAR